ncbi:MAG: hypothetical protein HOM14_02990 [Gammaproteobacteria bacterium]|jgi:hypothetical protein|nr:hypothetical protein [Gammaproteobacteria bacterium]MBT3722941.1 hypothetical protein [Gammaproteobacteria bacterium]MBT4449058.1 hypothetical protein [Gammaproteobacteria bacterium]MBT6457014.1 hypothetical protein [Gammaproteobacteria bacterium]MBT6550302.1 hypothetical protein [Gammaproteobacteria bacterium]
MIKRKDFKPNIIDVEASGFDPLSYPIEVGVALDNGSRYSTLIHPVEEWKHWDTTAEKLHHIQRDTLLHHGKSVKDVVLKLNELLHEKTVYSDGWVVDKPWLEVLFFQAGVTRTFYISPLEMILSESQMDHWHEIKNKVIEVSTSERHRASSDAWVIQQTYIRTSDISG